MKPELIKAENYHAVGFVEGGLVGSDYELNVKRDFINAISREAPKVSDQFTINVKFRSERVDDERFDTKNYRWFHAGDVILHMDAEVEWYSDSPDIPPSGPHPSLNAE